MITRRRFVEISATAAFAPSLITQSSAQAWPNRIVHLVVPFPAGVAPDIGGRLIAARLSEVWGRQVVVENKPGAAGNIGTEAVARSTPDGYTVLMAAFTLAVNPFLYRSLSYDPVASFAPVTLVSLQPCVMVVPNSSPARSVPEFIAHAKANKGKINFASGGHGTSPHLAGELFKRMAGIEMTHVPYRSGAQQDLIAGRVDVLFAVGASGISMMRAGQARALAVTGAKRAVAAPELPTVAEAGLPGFDVSAWWGLFVPANTPQTVIEKIYTDATVVLAERSIKERFEQFAITPIGSTPDELSRYLRSEMEKWGPIIKDAGITIDG